MRQEMAKQALALMEHTKLGPALSEVTRAGIQTLLGAVQRAGSLEEIEIVLRYQAARSREANRSEDGRYHADLEKRLLELLYAAGKPAKTAREQAAAAGEQLAMIARVHRILTADKAGGRDGRA